ncbi:MAG TPA: TadE/TadG family type IV pilus assembly protein [Acidimicrobiia bacterium]|nr:TadE/TadG family type IV pilus assembly protein [Acidimicrobiia bacterium]
MKQARSSTKGRNARPGRIQRRQLRRSGDRGANLVEFAFVMPFLILLLLGIIEFGWVFATNLDVKHGAREGARITAVNQPSPGTNTAIGAEVCNRMDIAGVPPTSITWTAINLDSDPDIGPGDGVEVTVETNTLNTLSGVIDWIFGGLSELTSTVEIRIEQDPDWSDGTYTCT